VVALLFVLILMCVMTVGEFLQVVQAVLWLGTLTLIAVLFVIFIT